MPLPDRMWVICDSFDRQPGSADRVSRSRLVGLPGRFMEPPPLLENVPALRYRLVRLERGAFSIGTRATARAQEHPWTGRDDDQHKNGRKAFEDSRNRVGRVVSQPADEPALFFCTHHAYLLSNLLCSGSERRNGLRDLGALVDVL